MTGGAPRLITFFHTDQAELEVVEPVAAEAAKRGYRVEVTMQLDQPTELGVYCSHEPYLRVANADVAAVMLHDLGQAHADWPNFWARESWAAFDVGFIPGQVWVDLLRRCGPEVGARLPRCGIFVGGWPKADPYFDGGGDRDRGERAGPPTVLYAPSWENDLKIDDAVDAALACGARVVVKLPRTDGHQAWMDRYPETVVAIKDAEAGYRRHGSAEIELADSRAPIMDVLPGSDVVVSDESCVLLEGLLFDAVPISVATALRDRRYVDGEGRIGTAREFRELWYSHLGRASAVIMDVLDNLVVPRRLSLTSTGPAH
jgi:hypothetical protein